MKQCPLCSRTYGDQALTFCAADGQKLIDLDAGPAGADQPTSVLSRAALPAITTQLSRLRRPKLLTYGLAALGVLLVAFLGAAFAVWMMWNGDRAQGRAETTAGATSNDETTQDFQRPAMNISTPTPERQTKLETNEVNSAQTAQPGKERPVEDQARDDAGTSRITFAPGSVGRNLSGIVTRRKDYVLWAREGQSLAANVRSPNGCVEFESGGSSVRYQTRAGDSVLRLRNNCNSPTKFSLSVNVR
jgi:hypothetical protein